MAAEYNLRPIFVFSASLSNPSGILHLVSSAGAADLCLLGVAVLRASLPSDHALRCSDDSVEAFLLSDIFRISTCFISNSAF